MVSAKAADTIFALASAPGRAGVAVVRVSGIQAFPAFAALSAAAKGAAKETAKLSYPNVRVCRLRSANGEIIDQAVAIRFRGPASYTGEDVLELHIHGGRAVLERLTHTLAMLGIRPAEPGEFTRRAVENGKLDLTRAEAVADLVNAETDAQRRQALMQFEGGLDHLYETWRRELIGFSAWAEAAIDFSDEELPDDLLTKARDGARALQAAIVRHLDDGRRGEILRDGLHLTVIGPPNAGKSSLINALARRDVAIVSETAGTTRDVIEVRLDLGGYPVIVADTAGLRESDNAIEREGVRRALARAASADLVLLLQDGTADADVSRETKADLVVWNKSDLPWPHARSGLRLSLKTGEGLNELIDRTAELVRSRLHNPSEAPIITRARHRAALVEVEAALGRAAVAPSAELGAEDLRLALRALGHITGRVDVEDLLDVIFRDFCIGK
jgi:tRNA modification GTPase